MAGLCVASDLYLYGLPRGALASPGRVLDSASVAGDSMSLDGHAFATDDALQFRALEGGALPAPLVEGTTYYALPVDAWRFGVALTAGGAAIDLTTAGGAFVVIAPLPIEAMIEKTSRRVEDMLPAHVVESIDTANPPPIVRMTVAELAAQELLAMTGKESAPLTALWDTATKRLERWARGVPVRGTNAPASSQLASYAAVPSSPWRRYGGIA